MLVRHVRTEHLVELKFCLETKKSTADSDVAVTDQRRRQYLFNKRRSIQVGFSLGDVNVLMIGDVDRISEVRFGG